MLVWRAAFHRDDDGPIKDRVGQVADAGKGAGGVGRELDGADGLAGDLGAVNGGAAAVAGVDQAAQLFVLLRDADAEIGVALVEQQCRLFVGDDAVEGGGAHVDRVHWVGNEQSGDLERARLAGAFLW